MVIPANFVTPRAIMVAGRFVFGPLAVWFGTAIDHVGMAHAETG